MIGVFVAFSAIPPQWRSAGNDVIFVAAVLAAIIAVIVAIRKWSWPRRFMLWIWRRSWGRDERGTYLTPMVRWSRWNVRALKPQMEQETAKVNDLLDQQTLEVTGQIEAFRVENSAQHASVQAQLDERVREAGENRERIDLLENANDERWSWLMAVIGSISAKLGAHVPPPPTDIDDLRHRDDESFGGGI